MKSVLFINTKPPYSSLATREAIDAVLATAAFGVPAGLLFIDDGVFQLRKGQNPQPAELKRTAPMFEALDMYGVEEIHVCQASLERRGLQPDDLIVPVQIADASALRALLNRFDHLLTF